MIDIILPLDVRSRLHARAKAAGHLHPDGLENIGGLVDAAVAAYAAAHGHDESEADFQAVCHGEDLDLANLATALARARAGLPAVQHPIAAVCYLMPQAALCEGLWVVPCCKAMI